MRAILNLSEVIDNQKLIVECGTIPELVQLTKTGSQKAQVTGIDVATECRRWPRPLWLRLAPLRRAASDTRLA